MIHKKYLAAKKLFMANYASFESSPWAANVSGCSKRTRHAEKEI